MTFVNQIAEIVHGVVDEFWGSANKNNGDTFLLIWRISDQSAANASKYADMSMVTFAKILGSVQRAPVLAAYRKHPGLQQRLGTSSGVSLTFGLHQGWAIEGAVGSEFKIDASYLSPNVSIASSVEAATAVYGIPILVSQSVIELGSAAMASKCRLIDRVLIRGSPLPIGLYSLDLDFECLSLQQPRDPRLHWSLRVRFKARQFLEVEKQSRLSPDVKTVTEFESMADVDQMRKRYTIDFLQLFHRGFENYQHGEWHVARRLLSNARTMLVGVDDGPCVALLRFMEHPYDFKAPDGWQGIHPL
jgi:class 3 adenylate cyclase